MVRWLYRPHSTSIIIILGPLSVSCVYIYIYFHSVVFFSSRIYSIRSSSSRSFFLPTNLLLTRESFLSVCCHFSPNAMKMLHEKSIIQICVLELRWVGDRGERENETNIRASVLSVEISCFSLIQNAVDVSSISSAWHLALHFFLFCSFPILCGPPSNELEKFSEILMPRTNGSLSSTYFLASLMIVTLTDEWQNGRRHIFTGTTFTRPSKCLTICKHSEFCVFFVCVINAFLTHFDSNHFQINFK